MKRIFLGLALVLASAIGAENISGTYIGTAKVAMPDGIREGSFTIVLKEDGEKFFVSGAPTSAELQPARRVGRSGNSLRFELTPPGPGEEAVKFDVTVKNGKMLGKMITLKAGRQINGTVELAKRWGAEH